MRFSEQKKRLNHFDLSVFKGLEPSKAEWTGLEPYKNRAVYQLFTIACFRNVTDDALTKTTIFNQISLKRQPSLTSFSLID
jgi:hypothetical protein